MITMITVTIVMTCFIQNGACSMSEELGNPEEDQNIDRVTLYRTALSQPVRERALIFTLYLITFLTSAQPLRRSLLTSKDWAGFRCLDCDHLPPLIYPSHRGELCSAMCVYQKRGPS